jgi:hypothetical protein
MPEPSDNTDSSDNDDLFAVDPSQDQGDHELTFLAVVGVVFVVAVILFGVTAYQYESLQETNQKATTTGSKPVATTDDLPDGTIVPESEVVINRQFTHQGNTQRIVTLRVNQSVEAAYDYYKGWLRDNGYELERADPGDTRLVGQTDEKNLTVRIQPTGDKSTSTVQFNYTEK